MPGLKQVGLQIAHWVGAYAPVGASSVFSASPAAGSLSLRPAFRPIVLHPVRDRLLFLG